MEFELQQLKKKKRADNGSVNDIEKIGFPAELLLNSLHKVAKGGGQWEIFEECRKAERPGNYTETIRMLGPDLMQMRRQAARLKIARPLRYTRCSIAAPGAPGPASAKAAPHGPAEGAKPAEIPKP